MNLICPCVHHDHSLVEIMWVTKLWVLTFLSVMKPLTDSGGMPSRSSCQYEGNVVIIPQECLPKKLTSYSRLSLSLD